MVPVFSDEIVIEVHAGCGGEDSKLFVVDLFDAYCRYAAAQGFKVSLLSDYPGHITAKIVGKDVFSVFKNESGSHVVQRIPPTERNDRRQTSYVMVAILPLPPENEKQSLNDNDLEVTFTGGTGPGGQHRNKTASCVRMIHKPTKLQVVIDGRDQHQNRRYALRILSARVAEHYREQKESQYNENRKQQLGGGGRGDKIRTYNFCQSRAVDHRTGKKTSRVKDVIEKGRFDLLT